jgi:hypothetical protein
MSRRGFPQHETAIEHVAGAWRDSSGNVTSQYDYTVDYNSFSADSIGVNTPGWPTFKQENSYNAYRSITKHDSAHWDGFTTTGWQGAGTWPMQTISSISDLSGYFYNDTHQAYLDAYNKCLNNLITNVKNQKVNVGNLAAEFKQTCGTITDAASRIAGAIKKVKRGNLAGALGTLLGGPARGRGGVGTLGGGRKKPSVPHVNPPSTGSVANDWLSIQYGWRPILSDVYGACEELANRVTSQPDIVTATGNGKVEIAMPIAVLQNSPYPHVKYSGTVNYSCKGVIKYRARTEWADILRTTGLINPLEVAWEVIPYSFVVDWFLPVGNFLNNLDYDLGIEFSRGWITTKADVVYRGDVVHETIVSGGTTQNWSGGSKTTEVHGFSREILGSFPNVPRPEFKNPISLGHVENALALLRQAFG